MVTTNISKTRSNDGAKIVASIKTEIYRDGGQTSLLRLRIVINRPKGVVTIFYWNGLWEMKPSIVSVIPLEDLLAEGLIYKHVSHLVDQVSMDQIDSKKLIEALVNDSSW
jgi:hypothetical protein